MTLSLRGTCTRCGRSCAVRQDGKLRAHGRDLGTPAARRMCEGSRQPPKEDTGRD